MNLKCWADIDQVLQDTGASRFNVGRSRDYQSNNNVFVYDKEKSFDDNKQICERLLQRVAGEMLYLTVWRGDNAKTSGCTYYIQYASSPFIPTDQQPAQQHQVAGGLYGAGNNIDVDKLTQDIEQRIMNRYEKERLDRERKELQELKRELESQKNSAIGLIAQIAYNGDDDAEAFKARMEHYGMPTSLSAIGLPKNDETLNLLYETMCRSSAMAGTTDEEKARLYTALRMIQ